MYKLNIIVCINIEIFHFYNLINYNTLKEFIKGIDEELNEINNQNNDQKENIITDFNNIDMNKSIIKEREDNLISMEKYCKWKYEIFKRKNIA